MKTAVYVLIGIIVFVVFVGLVIGSYYNSLVTLQENVKEKWSQVENVYQRRLDLIPNLVETVKGYAKHEKETLKMVVEARAKALQMKVDSSMIEDQAKLNEFIKMQNEISSSLSRLLLIVENYPDLKANQNFLALQSQLEGTENRIAVERRRYNEAVKLYNTKIRRFPGNVIASLFGFKPYAYFKAQSGANVAPKVKF